jgi:carbamoyl-phosphate synthase large subunit
VNILLTWTGRRNYLIQCFKAAVGGRGQVIACDASELAPALAEADQRVILPPADRPDYLDVLLAVCRERRVRLLFPLCDVELAPLAQHADRFRALGTIPVLASPGVIATCLDKWASYQWLRSCDIPTPATYLTLEDARGALARGDLTFPLLLKPRWGSSSIGIEQVNNERELALGHEWGRIRMPRTVPGRPSEFDPEHCLLIQELVRGEEYGMDVVNGLDGRHVCTLGRQKLRMRSGETDRARTVRDGRLDRLGKALGERLEHIGNLDCDVMATERGVFVLDLNPRLGGGYPLSHLAGANLPAAFLAWANGEEADPAWFQPRAGVVAARCDRVVAVGGTDAPAGGAADGRDGSADSRASGAEPVSAAVRGW